MEEFDEFSLRDLSKRKDFDLASATTRWYSKERTSIEGDAPKSTKLIEVKLNKEKNTIECSLLVTATEKYGPTHIYKSVNPQKDFAIERDPSGLYTIYISFLGLNKLYALAKSRQQKKKFNPQDTRKSNTPVNNISIEEIKAFLTDTDFKIFCDDVSWQYQGANYKLSQLGGALWPTNIPPTHKHLGPDGKTRMGWLDIHPMNSILTKHTLEFFVHIKFFLNQIAGSVLKQIRNPNLPGESNPTPPPTAAPKAPIPSQNGHGSSVKPIVDINPTDTPVNQAKTQALQQKDPAQQIMANRTVNSPVNQQIQQSQAYPGNPNENPQQYNLDKEETPMPESTVQSPYGPMLIQEVEGKQYRTWFNNTVEHLKHRVLELDSKYENYEFELPMKLNVDTRTSLYESLSKLKEIVIQFETGAEEQRYQQMIQETLNFIKENSPDIITFESTLLEYSHAHMSKVLAETIQLAFPIYNKIVANSNNSNDFTLSLIKRDRNPLHEIDSFPGNKEQTGEENPEEPKGKADMEDPNKGLPAPPTEEDNKVPGKKLVCAFGSFNPPTKQHFEMLKKVKATADHQQAEAIVFLQRDKTFSGDEVSVKQRAQIIEELTKIKCCFDKEITDFNAAMDWAYTHHYNEVMVIAGSDETKDMLEIGTTNKGQHTAQGFFDFEHFRVASYGGNNPDNSEESIEAVNAIMNNDEQGFLKAVDLPYVKQLKKLFAICRYELQNKMGMNESAHLQEANLQLLYNMLINPKKQQDLVGWYNDGTLEGRLFHDPTPTNGTDKIPYKQAINIFKKLYKPTRDTTNIGRNEGGEELQTYICGIIRWALIKCYGKEVSPEQIGKDLDYGIVNTTGGMETAGETSDTSPKDQGLNW
jgi:hypothetical protein